MYDFALGAKNEGELKLDVALSGCTSAVLPRDPKSLSRFLETISVPMVTVDWMFQDAKRVDALFLDVERYEIQVLEGAVETIRKHHPVITVEVLKGEGDRMLGWMSNHGYTLRNRAHNDWIFSR